MSSLIANSEQSTTVLTDGVVFKRDINIASIDSQIVILCERLLLIPEWLGEIHDAVRMGCTAYAEEVQQMLIYRRNVALVFVQSILGCFVSIQL